MDCIVSLYNPCEEDYERLEMIAEGIERRTGLKAAVRNAKYDDGADWTTIQVMRPATGEWVSVLSAELQEKLLWRSTLSEIRPMMSGIAQDIHNKLAAMG